MPFRELHLFTTASKYMHYDLTCVTTTSLNYSYEKLIASFYAQPSNSAQKFRTPTLRPFLAIEIKYIKGG